MARLLISNSFPTQPILRQLPRTPAHWCQHEFVLDPSTGEDLGAFDGWIIYDDLLRPTSCHCHRSRTMLITGEPPSVRRYRAPFASQFAQVRTSHSEITHRRADVGHEAQPWHYGLSPCQSHAQTMDYDALSALPRPSKTKLLSVIASNKAITEDHCQRLRFVDQLRHAFGDQIDVFGRGIRDVPDKADAIWNYKYHIVLENDHSPYYMSEKLPDAFLGWCFPFYFGGPCADGCFPKGSFARIDIYDFERSLDTIRHCIRVQAYESSLDSMGVARSLVLNELNLFHILCKHMDYWNLSTPNDSAHSAPMLTLYPKKQSVRLTYQRCLRAMSLAS